MSSNPFLMLHNRLSISASKQDDDDDDGKYSDEDDVSHDSHSDGASPSDADDVADDDDDVDMAPRFKHLTKGCSPKLGDKPRRSSAGSFERLVPSSGAAASPIMSAAGVVITHLSKRPRSSSSSSGEDSSETDEEMFPQSKLLTAVRKDLDGFRGSTLGSVNLQLQSTLRLGSTSLFNDKHDTKFQRLGFAADDDDGDDDDDTGDNSDEESADSGNRRRVRINSNPELIVYTPKTAMTDDSRSVCSHNSDFSNREFDIPPVFIRLELPADALTDAPVAGPSGLPLGLRIQCRNVQPDDNPEFWADRTLTVSPTRAGKPAYLQSLRLSKPTERAMEGKRRRRRNEPPGAPKAGVNSDSDTDDATASETSTENEARKSGAARPAGFPGWATLAQMRAGATTKRPFAKEGFAGMEGGGHATAKGASSPGGIGRIRAHTTPAFAERQSAHDAASGMKRSREGVDQPSQAIGAPAVVDRANDISSGSDSHEAGAKMARLTLSVRSPRVTREAPADGEFSPASSFASRRSRAGSERGAEAAASPTLSEASSTGSPAVPADDLIGCKAELRFITSADGVLRLRAPEVVNTDVDNDWTAP